MRRLSVLLVGLLYLSYSESVAMYMCSTYLLQLHQQRVVFELLSVV